MYKFEIKTAFNRVEYDKKFDPGNMANVNDILYANPMQGVMEQIQDVIHESDLAHDNFIKECIVSVGIDPDALKATAELNARLQKELRVARAMAVQKTEWISAENPPDEYRDEYGELIPFLVCCQGTVYPFRAMYDGTNWGDGIGVLKVTHWMPLPEPPKGD